MNRRIIIWTIVGSFAVAFVALYSYVLQQQHNAKAILRTLADVQLGVTNKDDFLAQMARFNKYKSSKEFAGYSNGKSYQSVGYAISNTVLGTGYSMFPRTMVSVSVYFDSNRTTQAWIVTIYNDSASVTIVDELDPPPGISADVVPNSEPAQWPEKRVLHQILPQDLKRISTSCFTSWFGCNTSKRLLAGRD